MKNTLFIIFLGSALAWTGCTKNNDNANTPPIPQDTTSHVSKITITDTAALLLPSLTKQISAAVTPASATNKNIIWQSTNNAVVSIDSTGMITGVSEGVATVFAISADRTAVKDSIKIYVRRNYDVYVAGQADSHDWHNTAVFWKNGVITELKGAYSIGLGHTNATAITVSNNDVYVSGTTMNPDNWDVASYWKNGEPVKLTAAANDYDTYASGIAVKGDSVYVAGWDFQTAGSSYISHAHYWKSTGTVVTDIPMFDASTKETSANGIALANGNVYVVGTQNNDNYSSIAKYWINNVSHGFEFTSGSYAQANAIAVSGNDVYVAGGDGCGDYGCINTPKIWKNNSSNAVSLTDGTRSATAYSIAISGNTVVVAGTEYNAAGKRVAKCWFYDGNKVTAISLSDGTADAMARAVTVKGDDIFIAGYESSVSPPIKEAKYWHIYNKAVLAITLPSTFPQNATGLAIFVQ